jgi:membrane protease YdiL (CAAX protease family)
MQPPGTNYWAESRRPLTSLVFTAPLLVAYESGVLLLSQQNAVRNGAEAWLRQVLDLLGLSQYFILPILTIFILLGWHYVTRQPWRFSRSVLYGMLGECAAMAVGLRVILRIQGILLESIGSVPLSIAGTCGKIAGFLGAGVYEELLFRLILLSLVIGLLGWLRAGARASRIGGILLTSLLFALAHYQIVNPYGDPFGWSSFLFRFLAGVFFSLLFLHRGFGIAAGTHAGYDVLVGLAR